VRTEFSSKVRVAAFQRSGGFCEKCTAKLWPGKFAYDHIIPDQFGGEATLENCAVLCTNCHGEKTAKADIPAIAKSTRVRALHLGAKTKHSRPMPGSRASGLKKHMDGSVSRRDQT
jgi:5-methylcytosine-specific restriction protein A